MKTICNLIIALLLPLAAEAQSVSYNEFMQAVVEKNTAYMAEKYNVDIAVANLQASKVFNDPEISVDYTNNQDWYMWMGQSLEVGLSYDLDLAGVRRARIRVARSEREVTEASVAAYLSSLRLDASEAWAEAWRLKRSVEVLEASVRDMNEIAGGDSIRLVIGDIGRTDAMQSRLEAQTLESELICLKGEYANALVRLSYLSGGTAIGDLSDELLPFRNMPTDEARIYEIAELNRADLRAAELSQVLSENNLRLVKASRSVEMGLSLGYSYNKEVRNEIAPAPKFNGLSVGVTIPLKFSSLNRGETRAARLEVLQSRKNFEDARMQIHMEASQALTSYQAAKKVLDQYDTGMLTDAKEIALSRKVGYQSGESSLLELLTAQQTYRDVMSAYIEACSNLYLCQAQMEFAIGY